MYRCMYSYVYCVTRLSQTARSRPLCCGHRWALSTTRRAASRSASRQRSCAPAQRAPTPVWATAAARWAAMTRAATRTSRASFPMATAARRALRPSTRTWAPSRTSSTRSCRTVCVSANRNPTWEMFVPICDSFTVLHFFRSRCAVLANGGTYRGTQFVATKQLRSLAGPASIVIPATGTAAAATAAGATSTANSNANRRDYSYTTSAARTNAPATSKRELANASYDRCSSMNDTSAIILRTSTSNSLDPLAALAALVSATSASALLLAATLVALWTNYSSNTCGRAPSDQSFASTCTCTTYITLV